MKKFPHEKFLDENSIDYKLLPEMLYKRIKGFEELKEDLDHTSDEDREKLTGKLEMLSHELLEDLEEHFEEHLENNDQEEDEQPEPIQEQEEPVIEEPIPDPVLEVHQEPIQEQEQYVVEESALEPEQIETKESVSGEEPAIEKSVPEPESELETQPEPEPVIEPTDEEILKEFIANQKYLVSHSELKEKGFKTALNDKTVFVGKLCLHKGKYDTCYKIIING